MGQRIQVEAALIGEVALFSLDRSLTGQDGLSFYVDTADGDEPPGDLANRLFAADDQIDHIQILSNTVTVHRRDTWDPETTDRASEIISNLFIPTRPSSRSPVRRPPRDCVPSTTTPPSPMFAPTTRSFG